MPIQTFELLDFFAPIVVGFIFSLVLFLLSLLFNFVCITKTDDITGFERLGAKWNTRLGPHRLSIVRACGKNLVQEDGEDF